MILPFSRFVDLLAASALCAAPAVRLEVTSSLDGTLQPSYLFVPEGDGGAGEPLPLLVSLHTWGGDLEQRDAPLEALAAERGWLLLAPSFRGPNWRPEACGSELAQQDILDAITHVIAHYRVDRQRVYLTGISGGGHMTLLMAGRHPEVFAAASAWAGIADLAEWHDRHAADGYGDNLRQVCGGAPGDGAAVDEQYRLRSPLTHLAGAKELPLDINAGIHDGHTGSVPIRHSLDAFNTVARAVGGEVVSEEEIARLSAERPLEHPRPSDQEADPALGRRIYLRRSAGKCRVTIFEGGHEGIAAAAVAFVERHVREP
ncbi:MAG: alpha/beta hydrolase [Armatimonadetes bacterium]|nr:alpha/beta hydrolase [Armatimonadota bacterium]